MGTYYAKGFHRHDRFIKQLDGSSLGGLNCTPACGAMCAHRHTFGAKLFTAATVRRATGDTVGGTNLDQIKTALERLGVTGLLGPYRGMPLASLYDYLRRFQRGAVVQGSSRATYGTRYSASSTFRGNHAWYAAAGRGWTLWGGLWVPTEVLIYDPLADGRANQPEPRTRSPFWLPRVYFERFLSWLQLGPETLGPGKAYALLTRDTWYHVHRRFGGVYLGEPKPLRVKGGYNIRTSPNGTKAASTVAGNYFQAWQRATGPTLGGSSTWYGDHTGTRWIHSSARAA